MKIVPIYNVEIIQRPYGIMKMLAGGKTMQTKHLDLRILEMNPNSSTSKHYHINSESVFYILQGFAELETCGNYKIQEGEIILIEPGELHLIRNIGTNKCIILETMAPPFSWKDIFYSEDSPFIG